jgi:hypothetical protein
MRFFKLRIYESDERLKEIENSLSKDIIEKIDNINVNSYDMRISENELISYFYIDENDLYFITDIFYENSVRFDYEDITFDVIIDKYKFNDSEFELFKKDYIKNNITLDIVLDKINIEGIKSLSEMDLNLLKSFS